MFTNILSKGMMKTTKRLLLALFLTAVVVSCGDKSQKEFVNRTGRAG